VGGLHSGLHHQISKMSEASHTVTRCPLSGRHLNLVRFIINDPGGNKAFPALMKISRVCGLGGLNDYTAVWALWTVCRIGCGYILDNVIPGCPEHTWKASALDVQLSALKLTVPSPCWFSCWFKSGFCSGPSGMA
jgi:hypothetical protein